MEKSDKQKLLELMQDVDAFSRFSKWTSELNIFDVLKISRTEIRHSNILGWLLDPNGSHGLNDSFLYSFLAKMSANIESDSLSAINLLASDLSGFQVLREWNNIDILLVSDNYAVAIENKIGSHEHKAGKTDESQLEKYDRVLNEKYKNRKIFEVFLTPEGEENTQNWISMSYSEVLSALQQAYDSNKKKLQIVSDTLIANYIATLKKEVIMDKELVQLCNEIYRKHKDALDLIYNYRNDDSAMIAERGKTSISNDDFIVCDNSTQRCIRFQSEKLNSFFKGSRIDKSNYFYEFLTKSTTNGIVSSMKLIIHQEYNEQYDEDTLSLIRKIGDKQKIGGKGKGEKHWRWFTAASFSKTETWENYDEDEIDKWMSAALLKIKKFEDKLLVKEN